MTSQINTCQSGLFPALVEDIEDKDKSTHRNMGETDEEVQDLGPAFDNDLDLDVDNIDIEEDDHVFIVMVCPVDLHHFVHTSSTVSGHPAEVSTKNSKPKESHEIVLMAMHGYANVFSEIACDILPQHRKFNHAIELECEPSPGFREVYPMTLTERWEMDAFPEEALATSLIRQSKLPLGAPVFFIKKDGKLCFVQDYHTLNDVQESLPTVEGIWIPVYFRDTG
jgi:hypothetical protein